MIKINVFWLFLFGSMSLLVASLASGQASTAAELIEGGLVISSPEDGKAVAAGSSITVTVEAAGSFDARRVMLLSPVGVRVLEHCDAHHLRHSAYTRFSTARVLSSL